MARLIAHSQNYGGFHHLEPDYFTGHALAVAMRAAGEMARIYGVSFAQIKEAFLSGLLHDIGKAPSQWQDYVPNNMRPLNGYRHEELGAYIAWQMGAQRAACAIYGHHFGMDKTVLKFRYKRPEYDKAFAEMRRLVHLEENIPDARMLVAEPPFGNLDKKFIRSVDSPKTFLKDLNSLDVRSNFIIPSKDTVLAWDKAMQQYVDIRLLFGCLVRADHLCTKTYVDEASAHSARHSDSMFQRKTMKMTDWKKLFNELLLTAPHRMRSEIKNMVTALSSRNRDDMWALRDLFQKIVLKQSPKIPIGLSTSVGPTGVGKTLGAILLGVGAIVGGNEEEEIPQRLLMVEPYITVLDDIKDQVQKWQTIDYEIFGPKIYEPNGRHDRSQFHYTHGSCHEYIDHQVNSETWDNTPVIFTSAFRLVDVCFSNHPRTAKMFPAMANSFIYIDEPQIISTKSASGSGSEGSSNLLEAVLCVAQAMKKYKSRFVFATATLPKIYTQKREVNAMWSQKNDMRPHKKTIFVVVPETKWVNKKKKIGPQRQLALAFSKKISISYDPTIDSYAKLASVVCQSQIDCLIKTNLKRSAYRTYFKLQDVLQSLQSPIKLKFMSGAKLPRHNEQTLSEVKAMLIKSESVFLVATGIIQCGVNLSFRRGFVEMGAPHDIIQPGGRVNREYEHDTCPLVIFGDTTKKEGPDGFSSFYPGQKETARIFQMFWLKKWIDAGCSIAEKLYDPKVYKQIMEQIYNNSPRGYENRLLLDIVRGRPDDVGAKGRLFIENDLPVLVECADSPGEVQKIIDHLDTNPEPLSGNYHVKLQENSVGVFNQPNKIQSYLDAGIMRRSKYHPNIFVVKPGGYDSDVGLRIYN